MFQTTNYIQFCQKFKTSEDCYLYLEEMKWKNGFICTKCLHDKYRSGNKRFERRCLSCGYNETLTTNTLFHSLKFDILKAFHIIFRLSSKKGISTVEIAKQYGVNQKTAWIFKRKFQESLSYQGEKFKAKVEVDEFSVGGKAKGKQGRSLGQKKPAFILVEKISDNKIGNIKIEEIKNYKAQAIQPILEQNTTQDSQIKSDKFHTYKHIQKQMKNLTTVYSNQGENFKELHNVIMNIKSWIRGIHHKVSKFHFQRYLDEFVFRFNMRNFEKGIFHSILFKFLNHKPTPVNALREFAV